MIIGDDGSAYYEYELIVTDALGVAPPRTNLGETIFRLEYALIHADRIFLDPGEEIQARLDIAKIYVDTAGNLLRSGVSHLL